MDIIRLQDEVLTITTRDHVERVSVLLDRVKAAKDLIRQIEQYLTEKMIEYIDANGEITIGDVRYYVGPKKITKCIDVPGAVAALLIASEGDFGKLCEFFTSQPLKYGACKEPLGDQWDQFFRVEEVQDLKEGKPKKALQSVNTKFLR